MSETSSTRMPIGEMYSDLKKSKEVLDKRVSALGAIIEYLQLKAELQNLEPEIKRTNEKIKIIKSREMLRHIPPRPLRKDEQDQIDALERLSKNMAKEVCDYKRKEKVVYYELNRLKEKITEAIEIED